MPGAFQQGGAIHGQEGVQKAVPAASGPAAAGHPVQLLAVATSGTVLAGGVLSGPAGFSLEGPMIDGQSRPRRRERVLPQTAAGTLVLLDLDGGQYYSLDEVSARVWELCDGEHGVEGIVEAI